MQVLIVEDEKYARISLQNLLLDLEPGICIAAMLDSVTATVEWLSKNSVDIIFLDIHLGDALCFDIFTKIHIKTPIIFTTAYDQYAINAFKVNSIDYLLKPIDKEELRSALGKYHMLKYPQHGNIEILRKSLLEKGDKSYQKRFIVKKGEKIASVKTEDIAYFEGEDRYVFLAKLDGSKYFVEYKLSELESLLDPDVFFRFNRSFIGHIDAIKEMTSVSKSRVKVTLEPQPKRPIIVSSENTRLFKQWLNK